MLWVQRQTVHPWELMALVTLQQSNLVNFAAIEHNRLLPIRLGSTVTGERAISHHEHLKTIATTTVHAKRRASTLVAYSGHSRLIGNAC